MYTLFGILPLPPHPKCNHKTIVTTTLPDGKQRVVTTIPSHLQCQTQTIIQILPSLPIVTTKRTHHADGSGSSVKETTIIIQQGRLRKEVTTKWHFVASPSIQVATVAPLTNISPAASFHITELLYFWQKKWWKNWNKRWDVSTHQRQQDQTPVVT